MAKIPPIGVTPRRIIAPQRRKELIDGINRYEKENRTIPIEWLRELNELIEYLNTPINNGLL